MKSDIATAAQPASQMPDRVTVGPWEYRVVVTAEPLECNGVPCDGLHDPRHRVIYVSSDVPADKRLFVLLHEIGHAWVLAVGRPKGEEGLCNFLATVCVDAYRSLGSLVAEMK